MADVTVVVTIPARPAAIVAGIPGPKGDKGDAGATGAGVTFVFTQSMPSASWTIVHNLNKYPSVIVVDSAGTQVDGEVDYNSLNQVTAKFNAPFSGDAYLN
jgi:hypothetical protein